MKLVKCKKCGATVMTADTLLTSMQEEFNDLVKKSRRVKHSEKVLISQQLKHLTKMMTAVCHSSSEGELRKNAAYNEITLLKKYIIENSIMEQETLDRIQKEAREQAKKKAVEDENALAKIYGDFVNHFHNNTKSDPTATDALKGGAE